MLAANENFFIDARFTRGAKDATRNSLNEVRALHAGENDEALVRAFLSGNQGSFAALVDRHMTMVYKFTYRYTGNADATNDIVQEVFIKVWKNIKKFDPEKNFKTWLLTIAKNTALDAVKKKKSVLFSSLEADGETDLGAFLAPYVEAEALPDEIMERGYTKAQVELALADLSPAHRSVLSMRYTDQMKFREIADALGESIDTVKSKHRRALMALRGVMKHPN